MDYIADILGIEVAAEPWDGAEKLPHYLHELYSFRKVSLAGVLCIFMKPNGEPGTLSAIKKHIQRTQEAARLPVVLELDGIAPYRRKSLLGARIPFAAPGCQLYLPFMGVALTERYASGNPPGETLTPSAQLLLFHYLYQKAPELHTKGLDQRFHLSAMQISRAVRQLQALGLIDVRKDGVRTVMSGTGGPSDIFEQAKPFLLNPVRKRIYAECGKLPAGMPLAGLCALAEMTRLSEPSTQTVAFFGKADGLQGTDTLIDNDAQAEVEIWKYNPALLSEMPGMVDPLSLAASLHAMDDARVEQAIEEMLKNLWG